MAGGVYLLFLLKSVDLLDTGYSGTLVSAIEPGRKVIVQYPLRQDRPDLIVS